MLWTLLVFSPNLRVGLWNLPYNFYQKQKNEASQATTPKQLKDSHSAELEDSIGEELTTHSSRDQASSSRDERINDESKSV